MKKSLKTVLAITVAAVLIGLIFFGLNYYKSYYNYNLKLTDLAEIKSDNGLYSVMIQQVGAPKGAFADSDVRVTVKNLNGEILHKFDSRIANDGKRLNQYNWSVEWDKETVTIILDGEEQEAEVFTLNLE